MEVQALINSYYDLDQTRAPIYEALERFRNMRVVPFDVPGHKRGRGNPEMAAFLGEKCVSIDVNSMKPLDNLCHPVSVIRDAEDLAADAFGAAHAFLMVGGTTSSVQTMVLATCKRGDKIILPRNVHRSVINALVLCGAVPVYVNPEVDHRLGISLGMRREQVAKAEGELGKMKTALDKSTKAMEDQSGASGGLLDGLKDVMFTPEGSYIHRVEAGKGFEFTGVEDGNVQYYTAWFQIYGCGEGCA